MKTWMRVMLTAMLMLALMIPATAGAYIDEDTLVVLDKNGQDVGGYIYESGEYEVTGKSSGYGITVANGADVVLYLNGVEIVTDWQSPFDCTEAGSVVLVLADGTQNVFVSKEDSTGSPGIWSGETPLAICCETAFEEEAGHECDENCGMLAAIGSMNWEGSGAGIGGGTMKRPEVAVRKTKEERNANGSNIVILGGEIYAQGAAGAAGIGGGSRAFEAWNRNENGEWVVTEYYHTGNGTNIEIAGGYVTAIGGEGAAGIGGAMDIRLLTGDADFSDMTQFFGGDGAEITISGGTVEAIGGIFAPGIGGGYLGQGRDITISGGNVYAEMTVPQMEQYAEDEDMTLEFAPVGNAVVFPGDPQTPDASEIVLDPQSGKQLAAKVSLDHENFEALEGSPFDEEADITEMVKGNFCLIVMEEDRPEEPTEELPPQEDPKEVLPQTGDNANMALWAALLTLSVAAYAAMKRRAA